MCIRDRAERIDTYKFELTQGKGDAENRTISATYRRGEAEGAFSVKGEWSAAIKRGTSTVTTTVEHDLTGAAGTDARTLEGTVTTAVKTAADEMCIRDRSNCFKIYDVNLALTGGGPANATEMVSMNIFNEIFAKSNYGYGQAKAIVFFIIVGVITMFQVRLTSKREVEV